MNQYAVLKFGGTSVADAGAMRAVADIVKSSRPCVVVLSATAGTTNRLLELAQLAEAGHLNTAMENAEKLKGRHLSICRELGVENSSELNERLDRIFDELESIVKGIYYLGETTARAKDRLLAQGELLSTVIFAEYLNKIFPASLVDAREFMLTDDKFGKANPLVPELTELVMEKVLPILKSGIVVVTQGFIGKSREGATTTLGRGGSDFTASLIGMALQAGKIEIWTDVSGVYTADPRVVPHARPVNYLTFEEASELAYFGAKVLHPSTILPAMQQKIPVYVKNTHQPADPGTCITKNGGEEGQVRAIAFKKGITMVTIESSRMLMAYGFLERLFAVFSAHETAVDLISTSEISVSLTIDDETHLSSIVKEVEKFARVTIQRKRGMIALVGNKIRERRGFLGEAFSVLKDVPVEMVSFGGSNINLSLIVPGEKLERTVRDLHAFFFDGGLHG
ncbi:MAG: lysine-sensitive aspartokinase 3 [Calditrichia bacterium]